MTHKQWAWSRTKAASVYLWPLVVVVAIIVVSCFFYGNPSMAQARQRKSMGNAKSASSRFENARAESGSKEDGPDLIRQRMEWFYKQRAFPLGHIPAGARMKAFEHMQRMMENEGKLVRQPNGGFPAVAFALPPAPGSPTWNPIGPAPTTGGTFSPVTGRVTTIAVDPSVTTGQTVLIGGAQGGIWRSTDGGATWTAVGDANPSLAMGSIAFAPSSPLTVYAGTGEQASTGFDVYYGAGVLKSTDGGQTWAQACTTAGPTCPFIGPFSNNFFPGGGARISYLSVNPANANLILVGAQVFTGGDTAGVYCSDDGGATWANIWPGQMATFVGYATSTIAYAALGRPFGSPGPLGGSHLNGIYKSINADGTGTKKCSAITFSQITVNGTGAPTAAQIGRVDIGIAPNDLTGNTIFASIADATTQSNTDLGIFKTADGGANWTKTAAPDICRQQCWFDNVVKVDSNGEVFFGGSAVTSGGNPAWIQRSTDAGATWASVVPVFLGPGLPHVDNHTITLFKAASSGKVIGYLGNDGGVWRTDDAEATTVTWANLNQSASPLTGLQLTQFYPSLSIHPSNPNIAFAGAQDNASQNLGDPSASSAFNWVDNGTCGDGGWTVIDPVTPTNVYVTCQRISIHKSVTGGAPNSFTTVSGAIATSGDTVNFIPPITVDPANPNRLYFGTTRVWQTTDNAGSWAPISGNIDPAAVPSVLTALAVGGSTGSVVYGGTSDGAVSVATNVAAGSAAFNRVQGISTSIPNRSVTQIVTDPADTTGKTAYVLYSGFAGIYPASGLPGDLLGHIFKTTDAGATWADVSCHVANCSAPAATDLPNIPVNDLVVDPTPTFNISELNPVSAAAGSAFFPLLVDGHGFTMNSKILFKLNANTTTITPTFLDAGHLSGVIPAAAIQTGGDAQVTVTDPLQANPTNALTFVVTGGGDFSLAFTDQTTMTVTAGQTATYTLTIAALNGFAGTVSLSCSLPATATTCSASPPSVNQAGNFTVAVTTTSRAFLPYLQPLRIQRYWPLAAPMILVALLVLAILLSAKRTRRQRGFAGATFALVTLFLLFETVGCGGGGGPHGTPAGTYTVTVAGTSGSTSHTANLTLVVN